MSAFLVEAEVIGAIIYTLRKTASAKTIQVDTGFDIAQPAGRAELAQALYTMNRDAVRVRYREEEPENPPKAIPHHPFTHDIPLLHLYKNLRCLLYQCDEGDIATTRPLYKTMDAVLNELAHHVITESSEYDAAPWGSI